MLRSRARRARARGGPLGANPKRASGSQAGAIAFRAKRQSASRFSFSSKGQWRSLSTQSADCASVRAVERRHDAVVHVHVDAVGPQVQGDHLHGTVSCDDACSRVERPAGSLPPRRVPRAHEHRNGRGRRSGIFHPHAERPRRGTTPVVQHDEALADQRRRTPRLRPQRPTGRWPIPGGVSVAPESQRSDSQPPYARTSAFHAKRVPGPVVGDAACESRSTATASLVGFLRFRRCPRVGSSGREAEFPCCSPQVPRRRCRSSLRGYRQCWLGPELTRAR